MIQMIDYEQLMARIDARRRADALRLRERRAFWNHVRKFIRVTTGL